MNISDISDRTASILIALFIMLVITLVSMNVQASPYNPPPVHHDHNQVTNGIDGEKGDPGRDGLSIKGDTGASGINGSLAITGAFAGIPTSSHVDSGHGHTSAGVAVGGYSGEQGLAVGITHMQDRLSGKAVIGLSGSETIYGVGAGFTF